MKPVAQRVYSQDRNEDSKVLNKRLKNFLNKHHDKQSRPKDEKKGWYTWKSKTTEFKYLLDNILTEIVRPKPREESKRKLMEEDPNESLLDDGTYHQNDKCNLDYRQ
jgi:hypothetical protein